MAWWDEIWTNGSCGRFRANGRSQVTASGDLARLCWQKFGWVEFCKIARNALRTGGDRFDRSLMLGRSALEQANRRMWNLGTADPQFGEMMSQSERVGSSLIICWARMPYEN